MSCRNLVYALIEFGSIIEFVHIHMHSRKHIERDLILYIYISQGIWLRVRKKLRGECK